MRDYNYTLNLERIKKKVFYESFIKNNGLTNRRRENDYDALSKLSEVAVISNKRYDVDAINRTGFFTSPLKSKPQIL